MLRVEGVEIERMGLGEGKGGMDGEGLEGLVEEFETRMRGLRGVLEGARGRRKDEA